MSSIGTGRLSAVSNCQLHPATYSDGDADDVVAASFACEICLAGAGLVLVSAGSAVAIAVCGECGSETVVELNGAQVVQLAVTPPEELSVRIVW